MACYSTTNYGTLSRCGTALPWQCGKIEKIQDEYLILDIKNLISSQIAPSHTNRESEAMFLQLKDKVKHLNFFPTEASRFLQLIYYVQLSDEQSPFSQSDVIIFKKSYFSDYHTKNWLRFALLAAICLPVTAWGLTTKPDNAWMIAANVIVTTFGGIVSWVATGSNPDFKSDSANERQDRLAELSETLMQIARTLIQLKFSDPLLAKIFASNLNIKKIEKKMSLDDPRSQKTPNLIALEAARCFILDEPLPDRTPVVLEAYILAISNS